MNIFDFFRERKKQGTTASIAKERLSIIVAHERGQRSQPDYLPALQKELVEVIRKFASSLQRRVPPTVPDVASSNSSILTPISDPSEAAFRPALPLASL